MRRLLLVVAGCLALTVGVFAFGCSPAPPAAAPAAAPPIRLVPPLWDAEPGERLVLGFGSDEFVHLVRSVHEDLVQMETQKHTDGAPVGARPAVQQWNRRGWGIPAEGVVRRIESSVELVHGRSWACWKLFVYHANGQRRYWITDELPAHGVLKAARVLKGREEDELALLAVRDSFDVTERARKGELEDAFGHGTYVLEPPLQDAEEGEELVLRLGKREYAYRVVESGRLSIKVTVSERAVGQIRGDELSKELWDRNLFGLDPGSVIEAFEPDRITIDGAEWACWRMTVRQGERRLAYWITEQLPVHGVLRIAPLVDGEPDLGRAYELAPTQ